MAAPAGGGYLPPVVLEFIGTDMDVVTTVAQIKALLADLAKQNTTVRIGGSSTGFQSDLTMVRAELLKFTRQVYRAHLGANAKPLLAEIKALASTVRALSPFTINVDLETAQAIAGLDLLQGKLADLQTSAVIGRIESGLAARAAAGNAAGSKDKTNWLKLLGFGAGGLGGIGGGLAGFGSLGSLAGFGTEHVLATLLGVGGSLVGGLLGGALLGGASLGVAGVGMGTDMAGIGQASRDIRMVTTDMTSLNQAIAVYGANSAQAAQAQSQLNYDLSSFSPAAQAAVLHTSNLVEQFKTMFDQMTGAAESTGATIIGQFVQLGEKFLPTIGLFAAQNTTIIKNALQPLIGWLGQSGGGLGIFTQLERQFQSTLPAAMGVFDNAIEVVIKSIGYLAPQTGGLIQYLNVFFTRLNSPAGFAKWTHTMDTLVGLFHTWWNFFKALFGDIYQIFHATAGLGSGIIQTLTTMLLALHKWIVSTSGQNALHSLFTVHKTEILDLLQVIGHLIGAFGKLYLAIAPTVVSAVNLFLSVLLKIMHIPFVGSILTMAAAFAILYKRVEPLLIVKALLGPLGAVLALFGRIGPAAKEAAVGTEALTVAESGGAAKGGLLAGALGSLFSRLKGGGGVPTQDLRAAAPAAGLVGGGEAGLGLASIGLPEIALAAGTIYGAWWLGQKLNNSRFRGSNAAFQPLIARAMAEAQQAATDQALWTQAQILQSSGQFTQANTLLSKMNPTGGGLRVPGLGKVDGGPHLPAWFGGGVISAQIAQNAKAAAAATTTYAQALAGITAPANMATAAVQQLEQVATNATLAIRQQTGQITPFTVNATESVAKMVQGMQSNNKNLATWSMDFNTLIQDGLNPHAALQLLSTMPQQLAVLLQGTPDVVRRNIVQMNIQWQEGWIIAQAKASGGTIGIVQAIIAALHSSDPTTRAAAQYLADLYPGAIAAAEGTTKTNLNHLSATTIALVKGMGPGVLRGAQHVAALLQSPFANFKQVGQNIGQNLMEGMAQGISSYTKLATSSGVRAAHLTEQQIRAASITTSPSLLFARIGRDWMLGLAMGIEGTTDMVMRAALASVPSTLGHARYTPGSMYGGGMNITVAAPVVTITAPSSSAAGIKAAMGDAGAEFGTELAKSLSAGAGSLYGRV